jgi:hypothetical protein
MSLNILLRSSFVRRLLLLSLVFVASSCGSGSGFSCSGSGDGVSVGVGSNLDASGVHHSVVDNSTDSPSDQNSTSDNQSSPGSTDTPDDQNSPVSLIDPSPDDSPDQNSTPGDSQDSPGSLDLPDPEIVPGETSEGSLPVTRFVIWSGKSYEPLSDCITVMWGRICPSN